jgi:AcrR family transcriptional regulator
MNSMGKSVREPRQKRSIEKKARIIQAAFRVFGTKGYYKTDTTDIAREAELATGTVYAYFKDKKAVFLEASKEFYAQVLEHLEKSFSASPLFREPGVDLRRIVEDLDTLPEHLWDFQKELIGLVGMDREVRECAEPHREEVIDLVSRYLAPMNNGKGCSRAGVLLAITFLQSFYLQFEDVKDDRSTRLKLEFDLLAKALEAVLVVEEPASLRSRPSKA